MNYFEKDLQIMKSPKIKKRNTKPMQKENLITFSKIYIQNQIALLFYDHLANQPMTLNSNLFICHYKY